MHLLPITVQTLITIVHLLLGWRGVLLEKVFAAVRFLCRYSQTILS